jgi:hypothetical protein
MLSGLGFVCIRPLLSLAIGLQSNFLLLWDKPVPFGLASTLCQQFSTPHSSWLSTLHCCYLTQQAEAVDASAHSWRKQVSLKDHEEFVFIDLKPNQKPLKAIVFAHGQGKREKKKQITFLLE